MAEAFSGDYTAHITKILAAKPDLLVTTLWGGDYVAFYKQALNFGLFDKMKVIANIAFGIEPEALEKDHPEGILAGAHSNYHFTLPTGEPMAAQQPVRPTVSKTLGQTSELRGRRRVHGGILFEIRDREGQSVYCPLARTRGDNHYAGGHGDCDAGRLPLYPARGSLGIQTDRRRL